MLRKSRKDWFSTEIPMTTTTTKPEQRIRPKISKGRAANRRRRSLPHVSERTEAPECKADQRSHHQTLNPAKLSGAMELSALIDSCRMKVANSIDVVNKWRHVALNAITNLMEVYDMNFQTVAHAVTLLDMFISADLDVIGTRLMKVEDSDHLHEAVFFGTACFLISSKYMEMNSPCLVDLARIVGIGCSTETIRRCEEQVLSHVNWDIHHATAFEIASELLHAVPAAGLTAADPLLHRLTLLAYLHSDFLIHPSSRIAAGATLACLRRRSADQGAASSWEKRLPAVLLSDPDGLAACARRHLAFLGGSQLPALSPPRLTEPRRQLQQL